MTKEDRYLFDFKGDRRVHGGAERVSDSWTRSPLSLVSRLLYTSVLIFFLSVGYLVIAKPLLGLHSDALLGRSSDTCALN